jgi:hypothetical protein
MQVNVLLFPLVLGIVPLVLAVLDCLTEGFQAKGTHEKSARTLHFRARDASCGLRSTARSAATLPQPLPRRWNGLDFHRNYWATMAAPSELVGDGNWVLWRQPDHEVPMRLPLPPQTRHGQLRSPRLGPIALN